MTRRKLLMGLFGRKNYVETVNAVSTAGIAADKAFLAWAETWNALIRDHKDIDRRPEDAARFDELAQAFRALEDAHTKFQRKSPE